MNVFVCASVVKKNNVLTLHVDSASEQSVGPKQSRSSGAKETVYLGGVPGEDTHTLGFVTLRDLDLDKKHFSIH